MRFETQLGPAGTDGLGGFSTGAGGWEAIESLSVCLGPGGIRGPWMWNAWNGALSRFSWTVTSGHSVIWEGDARPN